MEASVYTTEGKVSRKVKLPESIFGAKWNADLVAQVTVSQASNRRSATAHTKDRSEVSGGGKKPWQQKGLGRARHGSSRSPIWRHGGVTFGPRNDKSYKKTITRSMMNAALFSILSSKYAQGKILFVDDLTIKDGKTKEAESILKNLSKADGFNTITYKKVGNVYMTIPKGDDITKRSFRNLPYINLHNMDDLNPLDLANTRYVIITNPEATFEYLANKVKSKVK